MSFSSSTRRSAVFFPTPGMRVRRATSLVAQRGHELGGLDAGEDVDRELGAHPRDRDEPLEELLLAAGQEAEEGERVLAHVGVVRRLDLVPVVSQPVEGRDRDGHPVADASHVHDHLLRLLRRMRPRRCAITRARSAAVTVESEAWQSATARASAASPASPSPGQLEQPRHHERHLRLLRPAEARDLHLDRGGRERVDGEPGLRPRQQHHPAHVAEDEGGARVRGVEDVLHREGVGPQARDQLADARVDEVQALGQGEARTQARTPFSTRRWRRPSVSMTP